VYDRSLETLDQARLRAHQWSRLRTLVDGVHRANPFWMAKWRDAGLGGAGDLRDWKVFAQLPLTAKAELVADQTSHAPFGTNLTYPRAVRPRAPDLRHARRAGGGSRRRRRGGWWARCWGFVLTGAGVRPDDRVFFPFSFGLFIGFWAGFEGARALGALAFPGGGQDSPTRLASIESLGATVLVCTPSYALHLLQVARERGIDAARLPVRVTVHAGEPGAGIPAVRARIETGWGARAFDHAGMTEMGAYGYECEAQAGLHVNESEFIAEVIDPLTGAASRGGGADQPRAAGLAADPLPHGRSRADGRRPPRVRPDVRAWRVGFGRLDDIDRPRRQRLPGGDRGQGACSRRGFRIGSSAGSSGRSACCWRWRGARGARCACRRRYAPASASGWTSHQFRPAVCRASS
jgi:hypothetical protein